MPFLERLLSAKANNWLFGQAESKVKSTELIADDSYFEVQIESLRIEHSRIGFSKYHGAIHSFFSYLHEDAGKVQMQSLTSPGNLHSLDKTGAHKVIQLESTVLGPVPYRGGRVDLEIGLFAVESDDIGDSFLQFVSQVSAVGGVSFIKSAEPVLGLLKSGIDLLLGTAQASSLKLGVAKGISPLITGTFFAVAAEKSKYQPGDFTIDENDGRLLWNGDTFDQEEYLVFSIKGSKERHGWAEIPDLKDSYSNFLKKVRDGVQSEAEKALSAFRFVCFSSPDLLPSDQSRLFEKAESVLHRAFSGGLVAGNNFGEDGLPEFSELNLFKDLI